jgi:hypothetical protein
MDQCPFESGQRVISKALLSDWLVDLDVPALMESSRGFDSRAEP